MNKLLIFLFAILLAPSLHAQTMQIFDIDTTNFPVMKAKFLAFGADRKQIGNFSISDFDLFEDGIKRKILSVNCPNFEEPKSLSSVLTIDVSGSMAGEGLSISKSAATAWINALPMGKSECAITTFSSDSYLIQDFTNVRSKLLKAVNSLYVLEGSDYDAAYWKTIVSGLEVAKRGKYNRVLVFISDGQPNNEPQTQKIIDLANKYKVVVYCVTMNMSSPQCLKDISTKTGGLWFDNISKESEINAIYLNILNIAQNLTPCTIEWESEPQCDKYSAALDITLKTISVNSKSTYILPENAKSYLELQPSIILMWDVPPGKSKDTTISIKAINSDFNVSDVTKSNPNFSINPSTFSLKANESKTLTITYTPVDSLINFCTFEIINDKCKSNIYVRGGFNTKNTNNSTFKVTHPNGGERFGVGTDTIITWEGCSADEKVKLEYSFDDGLTWRNIVRYASGYQYSWKNIPNTPSSKCLLKASINQNPELKGIKIFGYGKLKQVVYSPDGTKLASCGSSGIFVWDIASGDTILSIRENSGFVNCIAFSPDGKYIASSGNDIINSVYNIKIWNVNSGMEIKTLKGNNYLINSISYSPDGSKIISGSDDNFIKIWDVSTGLEIRTLTGHTGKVNSVCFSPDGSQIISGSDDNSIKIWDPNTGSVIKTLTGHNDVVKSVCFSPDGSKIASGSYDYKIKIWDSNTGLEISTLKGHTNLVNNVVFSTDGSKLASGSYDYTVKLWDLTTGGEIKTLSGHKYYINSICFSQDGNKIVSGSDDNSIKFWDINTGVEINNFSGHTDVVNSVCFSPDGRTIAYGGRDKTIKFIDLNINKIINTFSGHTDWICSICFSPDGRIMASCSWDKSIKIWNVSTGSLISTLTGHTEMINSISFSTDGNYLASGSGDSTVILWDINYNYPKKVIKGHKDGVNSVCFSPDGSMIASGSKDSTIKLWNVNTYAEIKRFTGHSNYVNSINFSSDGSKIVSGSSDKSIKIWDVNSGLELKTLSGHTGFVNSVCFSQDGSKIASGSYDNTIKLWDVNTGLEYRSLSGHTAYVNSVSFNTDGNMIASGSGDGTVRIWSIDKGTTYQDLVDISDSVWSIIKPKTVIVNIDMQKVLIGSVKDSVIKSFIVNMSNIKSRIDSIRIVGINADQFAVSSTLPQFYLEANQTKNVEFLFKPTLIGIKSAKIYVYTPVDTVITTIKGEGILPQLSIENKMIDFGQVTIARFKDTIAVTTIKNTGTAILNISNTKHDKPNDVDFTTLSGGGSFALAPGETHKMNLRFTANDAGFTNGTLNFEYDGVGSPAKISLIAEGLKEQSHISTSSPKNSYVKCSVSKIDTIKIYNSGEDTLRISDISITGLDYSDFSIIKNPAPIKLSKSDTTFMIYSFVPNSSGIKRANIEITSNSIDSSILILPLKIYFEKVEIQSVNEVDFGGLLKIATKDTIINISNQGITSNRYFINSTNSAFSVTPTDIILAPNQSLPLNIHYNGSLTSDSVLSFFITITDTICSLTTSISVKAVLLNNMKLESENVEAFAGDTVLVQIYLRNDELLKYTSIKSINFELQFNATLLLPIDYDNQSKEINGNRLLNLSIPVDKIKTGKLAVLKMIAGLGNESETLLKLQNIKLIGGTAELDSAFGTFKLLGICPAGGNRFINPTGKINISSIKPNPSDIDIEVQLELIEKTGYKLIIVNSSGQTVRQITRINSNKGIVSENIEVTDLASGVYNLILQTESERISKLFLILK